MTAQSPPDLESFKQATDATLRAIAGKRDIEVTYTPTETLNKKLSLTSPDRARLPTPALKLNDRDRAVMRGTADAEGLRLRHHNAKLHAKNAPTDERAKSIHDALEMARIESLGARDMVGIRNNLNTVMDEKFTQMGYHNLTTQRNDTLPDALHLLARMHLTGEPLPPAAQKLADIWAPWIHERLGDDWFQNLEKSLDDQNDYGRHTRNVLRRLEMLDGDEENGDSKPADEPPAPPPDQDGSSDQSDMNSDQDQNDGDQDDTSDQSPSEDTADESDSEEKSEAGMEDEAATSPLGDDVADENMGEVRDTRKDIANGPGTTYAIYTTEFDEIVKAEELADDDELFRLRGLLDKQLVSMQGVIVKLANRLQRKLLARQRRAWQFDLEEGYLDSSRLARVVANPTVPLSFKQEKESEFKDTVVTILIDNSGSMRGRPITTAAMCADILARTLERCAIKVEILGFTTRTWKGGKSRDLWIANGRPEKPGRLNDLRHIIYKSADAPHRRTRKNLGLMLKEGLLKENIDGEALVWAYNRLAARGEDRKILMVISDGAPVDDSTLSVNLANVLENDLRHVINWIEMIGKVDLTAIGIGHDVTRYYSNAITISDVTELGEALVDNLTNLFDLSKG
ncbi:MAG: cobaltochelatase subunit CobT [Alphaproteobacteria bacterium RIFCSPHIGHO2_12_FULL_45_9]|nr:MAG: cobaltochelatase subunit CobT [Alphaproteobacteria bacterium RIFCSPHIGHO2_12_FULL_45_9]